MKPEFAKCARDLDIGMVYNPSAVDLFCRTITKSGVGESHDVGVCGL
jgi:hypothetical protein